MVRALDCDWRRIGSVICALCILMFRLYDRFPETTIPPQPPSLPMNRGQRCVVLSGTLPMNRGISVSSDMSIQWPCTIGSLATFHVKWRVTPMCGCWQSAWNDVVIIPRDWCFGWKCSSYVIPRGNVFCALNKLNSVEPVMFCVLWTS